MPELKFQRQIGASWGAMGIDIRDLSQVDSDAGTVVVSTTGPGGGMMSLLFAEGQMRLIDHVAFDDGMRSAVSGFAEVTLHNGQKLAVLGQATSGQNVGYELGRSGEIGALTSPTLPMDVGNSGPVTATSLTGYIYTMTGDGRLQGFRADAGAFRPVATHDDTTDTYAADPVALKIVQVGGTEYLVSLCGCDTGISTFRIDARTGGLTHVDSLGVGTGLGLLKNPTGLQSVSVGGVTYVLVSSAADGAEGGALTVARVESDGALQITDHILDSRDTRFGAVHTLEVAQVDGWTYVVAGGGDAGLSLFTLLPEGRLLHLDTIEDSLSSGLERISALTLVVEGTDLHVLAASQASQGLAHLTVDLSRQGVVREGNGGATQLDGQDRNDLLIGGKGDDQLRGMGGNDTLVDGAGRDRLIGGAGADTFVFGADGSRDEIRDFEAGIDRIDLSAVPMLYDASRLRVTEQSWGATLTLPGDEQIAIYSAQGGRLTANDIFAAITWETDRPPMVLFNEITDGPGSNLAQGGRGTDIIHGMDGDDTLSGMGGDDILAGGAGDDRIYGGTSADSLYGGFGNDLLDGEDGDDMLQGWVGADTLRGGDGDDTMSGGDGNDLLDGQDGDDSLDGGVGHDWVSGGLGHDWLTGDLGNDHLLGGFGNDTLDGGYGFDLLQGGFGHDLLIGGGLRDTLLGEGGNDTLLGGFGNDRLEGADGDDLMNGGVGNDLLIGGDGDDTLLGWNHRDTLQGGEGNDQLEGQYGADVIDGGGGDDWIHGGAMGDQITGGDGNDTVNGGSGADTVWLGAGNDLFNGFFQWGFLGRDTIWGGDGNDTILASAGHDVVHGEQGNDLVSGGLGFDYVTGGNGHDTLWGGGGNDTLYGGSGEDRLEGGSGVDMMTGGLGADTFVFHAHSGARNIITDFEVDIDHLLFEGTDERWFVNLNLVDAPRGVWVEWSGGGILLEGVTADDLDRGDAIFL